MLVGLSFLLFLSLFSEVLLVHHLLVRVLLVVKESVVSHHHELLVPWRSIVGLVVMHLGSSLVVLGLVVLFP